MTGPQVRAALQFQSQDTRNSDLERAAFARLAETISDITADRLGRLLK